jgi:cytidyltransferase-like protein
MWIVHEDEDTPQKRQYCSSHGIIYRTISEPALKEFPISAPTPERSSPNRKVLVTGCYDWFHSGHVRFFEETSQLGDLYVVVGHDENVRLLKGEGHPLFPEQERRYMVGAIRFVKQALISTGHGWMDAEPEIEAIRPDIYAVNEDGDQPEKRQFCEEHGLKYVVLKRTPAAGLPRRESTHLRGF